MRFGPTTRTLFNHQPFAGSGVSLYVTPDDRVQYRNQRAITGRILRGTEFDVGATSVLKTARVTHGDSPLDSLTIPVNADWYGQTITVDVRTFCNGVENESDNSRTQQLTLDGGGADTSTINGTATLLNYEQHDSGVIRVLFSWEPAADGVQPDTFTLIRTAGPSSPTDIAVTVESGVRLLIAIDTMALSDASAYTYKIRASLAAVTADVLTGISITADATGPVAPTGVTAEGW